MVRQRLNRGEIWLLERPAPDKRRPVLVLSHPSLLRVLNTATVAMITSTIRGAPTEVLLGVDEGLKGPSCVNLANVNTVRQAELQRYVGVLPAAKLAEVCPVYIFTAHNDRVEIVEENLDECVLCELCINATPAGSVSVIKLYSGETLPA